MGSLNYHSAATEEGVVESMSPSSQPIISCLDHCSSPPWSPLCRQLRSTSSTCDLNALSRADLGCCHSLAPSPRLSSTQNPNPIGCAPHFPKQLHVYACSALTVLPLVHLMIQDHQASAGPRTRQALSHPSALAHAVPSAQNASPALLTSWGPADWPSLRVQLCHSSRDAPHFPTPLHGFSDFSHKAHRAGRLAELFSIFFAHQAESPLKAGLGLCHFLSPGVCIWLVLSPCLHCCEPRVHREGLEQVEDGAGLWRAVTDGGQCAPWACSGHCSQCLQNGWGRAPEVDDSKEAVGRLRKSWAESQGADPRT